MRIAEDVWWFSNLGNCHRKMGLDDPCHPHSASQTAPHLHLNLPLLSISVHHCVVHLLSKCQDESSAAILTHPQGGVDLLRHHPVCNAIPGQEFHADLLCMSVKLRDYYAKIWQFGMAPRTAITYMSANEYWNELVLFMVFQERAPPWCFHMSLLIYGTRIPVRTSCLLHKPSKHVDLQVKMS